MGQTSRLRSSLPALPIRHDELGPLGSRRAVTGLVADEVVAAIVVVVSLKVETELCGPTLVERCQTRGVETCLGPRAVGGSVRQVSGPERRCGALKVARL